MDQQVPVEIKDYLKSLLNDAGMEPIDDLMEEQLLNELYVKLDNHITSVLIKNIPPQHLDEFMKINDENRSKEEIDKFIKEKMPNYEEVLAKAFIDFRDLYLGNTTVVTDANPTS